MNRAEVIPAVQEQKPGERRETLCLALGMYQEARSESEIGQRAVAHVILNRRKAGASVCDTMWTKGFQWTKRSVGDLLPKEQKAWDTVQQIAVRVLMDRPFPDPDPTRGANMFYNYKLCTPYWADNGVEMARFGDHAFVRL